jgi:glutathione S-transferase
VQKVLWLLDELALDYKHIECGGKHGGLNTTEFSQFNPLQKVPVLIDDGFSIWESNSILRYLVASYGCKKWYSASPFERSEYEKWMDWSIDKLETSFVGLFWGFYRTPESQRDITSINKHLQDYTYCLAIIDKQLMSCKYISGENISLSDIALGVFVYRLQDIGLSIELPPNVHRWYTQLKSRNGYAKWVMSDFSELKGRFAY